MRVDRKTHLQLRAQGMVFLALFVGAIVLLGFLSTRYHADADWTATHRNSLSDASIALLAKLDQPVTVTAFARDDAALRDDIRETIGRYQRYKKDLTLEFVNPDTAPDRVRSEGITVDGQLVLSYGGRTEKLASRDESDITNALQRLARSTDRYAAFVEGHGERDPHGERNFDLGSFGDQLTKRGFKLTSLNLASAGKVPDNTAVLVIAGPRTDYLPVELKAVQDWVAKGGNLLWLGDPGPTHGLDALADELGIAFMPGTIVDPSSQLMGIDDPTLILVKDYPQSDVTRDFDVMTLFPVATALDHHEVKGWHTQDFLVSLPRAWQETGKLEGAVRFDGADRKGPLDLGLTLTRTVPGAKGAPGTEQRIAAVGDGDWLSNQFLGNGGNLDLGLNLIDWLAHDDSFINIAVRKSPDVNLQLSPTATNWLSLFALLIMPLGLVATGVGIWWRRRGR